MCSLRCPGGLGGRGGALLAKNHCSTKQDEYIQCVVLDAQGGLDEPPEPPLDLPLIS